MEATEDDLRLYCMSLYECFSLVLHKYTLHNIKKRPTTKAITPTPERGREGRGAAWKYEVQMATFPQATEGKRNQYLYNCEVGVVGVAGVECVAGERGALEANFEALNMFDILML